MRSRGRYLFLGLAVVGLSSCGGSSGPQGYLASFSGGTAYVQWQRHSGHVHGTVSESYFNASDPTHLRAQSLSVNGTIAGSDALLHLSDGVTWHGTLSSSGLSISYTASDGSIQTIEFRPASVADYNAAVARTKRDVLRAKRREATEQEVDSAASSLSTDDQSLQEDTSSLGGFGGITGCRSWLGRMADLSDLDGCRLKLARADQHLKALDQEIDWFLKRNPQLFTHERNAQTGEDLLWTLTRTNPPDEWSCIVGDILYNLRSCLDHLAWQLVLLAGNEPSTDTQFPVFKADPFAPGAKRDLLKLWERRVKGMDGRDVAKLKELQPYSGRNIDLSDHALLLLHDLNIWDKHRQLHLGAQQFRYGGFELDLTNPKTRSEFEITPFAPLDARAAALPVIRSQGQMEMKIKVVADISFRDGPWEFRKVRETLIHLANFVTDVVNEFEPRFREQD